MIAIENNITIALNNYCKRMCVPGHDGQSEEQQARHTDPTSK